jgi:hypothetical protein
VERDQHRVSGDESVERQESERRRRVDEDVVVLFAHRCDQLTKPLLAALQRDHLDFSAGQVAIGGNDFEPPAAGSPG